MHNGQISYCQSSHHISPTQVKEMVRKLLILLFHACVQVQANFLPNSSIWEKSGIMVIMKNKEWMTEWEHMSDIHNFWNWCCHLYSNCSRVMERQMIVLAYLGGQCTKFHTAGWPCWFLRPFIWGCVSGLMWFHDGSESECASNFVQISENVRRRPWQWLDRHLGRKAWAIHGQSKLTKTEKCGTGEEQRSYSIIFSHIKGIVHKEFILVGQTVNSTYYCDVSRQQHENLWRLHPELWQQKNWLLHHEKAPSLTSFYTFTPGNFRPAHTSFKPGNFRPETTWLPPPHPIFMFPELKIKLKGSHFDII
jgi:hypothetical protein